MGRDKNVTAAQDGKEEEERKDGGFSSDADSVGSSVASDQEEGIESGTDYETGDSESDSDPRSRGTGGEASGKEQQRRRRCKVLCAYEFTQQCSLCFEASFQVCALRVEVESTGRALCSVLGDSPLKKIAKKHGIKLGMVCPPGGSGRKLYLGRACPACSCGATEFESIQYLSEKDKEWRDTHRTLSVKLPRRLPAV